jgi:hypothetical protein
MMMIIFKNLTTYIIFAQAAEQRMRMTGGAGEATRRSDGGGKSERAMGRLCESSLAAPKGGRRGRSGEAAAGVDGLGNN